MEKEWKKLNSKDKTNVIINELQELINPNTSINCRHAIEEISRIIKKYK
ncbi:MAG: hypothetical protein HQ536_05215 [Parcubacteria group bacterium]|nr:hypothetical protein [Parcubacteria group bacterium]